MTDILITIFTGLVSIGCALCAIYAPHIGEQAVLGLLAVVTAAFTYWQVLMDIEDWRIRRGR